MKVHASEARTHNSALTAQARARGEGNVRWLQRGLENGAEADCSIVLIGGADLNHFRLRVAQSGARSDLLPSYWSHVAILADTRRLVLHEVSVEPSGGFRDVASTQGIQSGRFRSYDDATRFPNVALVHWKLQSTPKSMPPRRAIGQVVERLVRDRGGVDVRTALWTWLGFVWGVPESRNPLASGIGVPSAVLVETVFAMLGIELTPGLASQSSCPEAIWQSAKWWADYYDSAATLTARPPWGSYVVDQPAAAVTVEGPSRAKRAGKKRR